MSQVVARKPWTTRLGLGLFCALLPSACAHDVSLGENKPGSTDPSSNTMPPMVPSAAHGPGEDNEVEGDEGHSPEHEGQPESESDDEHGGADSDEDALGADGLEHDGHPANSADDNVDAHPEAPATSLLPESEHEVPVEHSDAGTLEQGADAEPIPPTDMATPLDLASHDQDVAPPPPPEGSGDEPGELDHEPEDSATDQLHEESEESDAGER